MKISAFITAALLAATVTADKPNVRAGPEVALKKNKNKNNHSPHYMGATVSVAHLSDDPTGKSDEVIAKAFKNAYELTHGDEFQIDGAFINNEISIPEDDTANVGTVLAARRSRYKFNRYFWLNINYHCRLCSDDSDYLPPLPVLAQANKKAHMDFEEEFCKELSDSGVPDLELAANCAIEFTYSAVQAEQAKALELQAAMRKGKGGKKKGELVSTMGSQIMLTHVFGTDDHDIIVDMSVVSEAFAHAYNAIHLGSDYEVTSVELKREIDIPEDEDDGDNVELAAATRGRRPRYSFSRYFWTNINYHCRLCSDDSSYLPPLELFADSTTHQALQDRFCFELKNSGLEEYKDVRSCSIAFSYSTANNDLEVAAVPVEE